MKKEEKKTGNKNWQGYENLGIIVHCQVWPANPEVMKEKITPDMFVGERRESGDQTLVAKCLESDPASTFYECSQYQEEIRDKKEQEVVIIKRVA